MAFTFGSGGKLAKDKVKTILKLCDGSEEEMIVEKKVVPLIDYINSFHKVLLHQKMFSNPWAMTLSFYESYMKFSFNVFEKYFATLKNIFNGSANEE